MHFAITKTIRPFSLKRSRSALLCFLMATSLSVAATSNAAPRVNTERAPASKSNIIETAVFLSDFSQVTTITFRAVNVEKIEAAKLSNLMSRGKRSQVGINQLASEESIESSAPQLKWQAATNGTVSVLKVHTPGALGIRTGLKIGRLPVGAELRFAGSDSPTAIVHTASHNEVNSLVGPGNVYWTPPTDGDTQTIEIFLPANAKAGTLPIRVDRVSHLFATAKRGFDLAAKPKKQSLGLCNVDAICPLEQQTATRSYWDAFLSSTLMQFQSGSGSFVCNGTLLNDNDPWSLAPYVHGASHCFNSQPEANTLVTYWGYASRTCRPPTDVLLGETDVRMHAGGAQLLYADTQTDVLMVRLNLSPPISAAYIGWDASPVAPSTPVTVVHHPDAGPKKLTLGNAIDFRSGVSLGAPGPFVSAGYTSGSTQVGSSGSGLLTSDGTNYFFRGGLFGGPASCANSGSLTNAIQNGNYDIYSRFDLAFPKLRKWLFDPRPAVSQLGSIDINGRGAGNLVVRAADGQMQSGRLVNLKFEWTALADPGTSFRVLGAMDLLGNGRSDLAMLNVGSLNANGQGEAKLWRDFDSATPDFLRLVKPDWDVQAIADFDGDGLMDIAWRFRGMSPQIDDQGVTFIWFMRNTPDAANNNSYVSQVRKRGGAPLTWKLLGTGDFNQDGAADLVYLAPPGADGTSEIRVLMATPGRTCANVSGGKLPAGFNAIKVADFTSYRTGDILMRNDTTGEIRVITLSAAGLTLPAYTQNPDDILSPCTPTNLTLFQTADYSWHSDPTWSIFATGDFDGDKASDIVFRQPDNTLTLWFINPATQRPSWVPNVGSAPVGFKPIPLQ
jgi:hypothetical protein